MASLLCLSFPVGCGEVTSTHSDAAIDAAPDAAPDALGCTPTVLLTGGTDVTAQGWTVVMQAPATVTNGAGYVSLATTTTSGATTSGMLLLTRANTLQPGTAFALEVVALVETVNPHNQFDAGAAILGSFTPPSALPAERSQMIYLDASAVGWADDAQSAAFMVVAGPNTTYHTYVLAVTAAGVATVTIDGGAPVLSRTGFTTNGTIAIGDQTNDRIVDATMRIKSIRKLCM